MEVGVRQTFLSRNSFYFFFLLDLSFSLALARALRGSAYAVLIGLLTCTVCIYKFYYIHTRSLSLSRSPALTRGMCRFRFLIGILTHLHLVITRRVVVRVLSFFCRISVSVYPNCCGRCLLLYYIECFVRANARLSGFCFIFD